jgi:hypothetical protein
MAGTFWPWFAYYPIGKSPAKYRLYPEVNMRKAFLLVAAALLCLGAFSGCSVNTHENGKKSDVDVRTPFGSVSVHAGQTDVKDTGLALYPGARVKQESDKSDNADANVNVSSSFFGAKVVILKFESDDSPDKVLAFYRKDMGKYGKVVDCTGGFNLNFYRHEKNAPVTCDGHDSGHEYNEELKVGTENNQRILAIKPRGQGSEFALLYVRTWDGQESM